jgi:hypothetical protein
VNKCYSVSSSASGRARNIAIFVAHDTDAVFSHVHGHHAVVRHGYNLGKVGPLGLNGSYSFLPVLAY